MSRITSTIEHSQKTRQSIIPDRNSKHWKEIDQQPPPQLVFVQQVVAPTPRSGRSMSEKSKASGNANLTKPGISKPPFSPQNALHLPKPPPNNRPSVARILDAFPLINDTEKSAEVEKLANAGEIPKPAGVAVEVENDGAFQASEIDGSASVFSLASYKAVHDKGQLQSAALSASYDQTFSVRSDANLQELNPSSSAPTVNLLDSASGCFSQKAVPLPLEVNHAHHNSMIRKFSLTKEEILAAKLELYGSINSKSTHGLGKRMSFNLRKYVALHQPFVVFNDEEPDEEEDDFPPPPMMIAPIPPQEGSSSAAPFSTTDQSSLVNATSPVPVHSAASIANVNAAAEDKPRLKVSSLLVPDADVGKSISIHTNATPRSSRSLIPSPRLAHLAQSEVIVAKAADSSLTGSLANLVRGLVSKKKYRFQTDSFDLDLTYITPNIIAMGFPSEGLEAGYRNPMSEVVRFMDTRHPGMYKVYNLCSEKSYDPQKFHGHFAHYPFDDHNCPPFGLILDFCGDALHHLLATSGTLDLGLSASQNTSLVAVHCKAGKGRTGLMICCLLLHACIFMNAKEALDYYGNARASDGKGVTIPSQIRYVYYYEEYMTRQIEDNINMDWERSVTTLYKIVLHGIPYFDLGGGCDPYFKVQRVDGKMFYDSRKANVPVPNLKGSEKVCELNVDAAMYGDVKFTFYDADMVTKDEKMFCFWINTSFIKDNHLILQQNELDGAVKDKSNHRFPVGFHVELFFHPTDMHRMEELIDDSSSEGDGDLFSHEEKED